MWAFADEGLGVDRGKAYTPDSRSMSGEILGLDPHGFLFSRGDNSFVQREAPEFLDPAFLLARILTT